MAVLVNIFVIVVACTQGILGCSWACDECASSGQCIECDGYYYLGSGGSCENCPDNCHQCVNDTHCMECRYGYFVNETGQCDGCPDNCYQCVNGTNCTQCWYAHLLTETGQCENEEPPAEMSLRLTLSEMQNEGIVEIYHAGEWGTICAAWWEVTNAQVVCRQLGYYGGQSRIYTAFGEANGRKWLDGLHCLGSETNIAECDMNSDWGDVNCPHNDDAGVFCDVEPTIPPQEINARLTGSDQPGQGRVEIYHEGEWGTICAQWWHDTDAQVVCRQLGFYGGQSRNYAASGEANGRIWLSALLCMGVETTIAACHVHPYLGDVYCPDGAGDAGVVCIPV